MAITFDAQSSSSGSSVTSLTWSHTVSGTQRLLVVAVQVDSASFTGVTYAGVAMTRITNSATPSGNLDFYYLFTPTTGANNIVATLNTTASPRGAAASYNGVKGPSPDTNNSNGGTGTSLTVNLTTTVNNDWLIGGGWVGDGTTPGASGGSATARTSIASIGIIDSNAAISPAGATTLTITAGGSTPIRFSVMAIQPATVSPTTTTSSSTTSTSTSTSSSTSSSSTSTSSTTTATPPPDVDVPGIPTVYVRN